MFRRALAIISVLSSSCGLSSSAFLAPRQHSASFQTAASTSTGTTTTTALSVGGMGWDNEDFLDSLSKGEDAMDKANEQYNRLKRFDEYSSSSSSDEQDDSSGGLNKQLADDELPDDEGTVGAELTKDQVERIKKSHEEEESEGGEMFKKLLERAEQKKRQQGGGAGSASADAPQPPSAPMEKAPESVTPTAGGGGGSGPVLPEGFEKLSVEAQAALFRELMSSGGTPSAAETTGGSPPPSKQMRGLGPDGRKIGRNRDADAIVNSADVYFAQLKRDSSIRNTARYAGDQEKAEAVFADPSLQEIELHVNPYMEEQRKKERAMLETSPEEMIFVEKEPEQPVDLSDSGVSYKEKLQQMRSKKRGSGSSGGTPGLQQAESAAVTKQEPPLVAKEPETTIPEIPSTIPETPVAAVEVPPQPKPLDRPPISPGPVTAQAPRPAPYAPPTPPVASEPMKPQTPSSSSSSSSWMTKEKTPEELHTDIRTLMGLLLKHRGGPGFGSGRIKGPEIERFENLADEVVGTLRNEAAAAPTTAGDATTTAPSSPAVTVARTTSDETMMAPPPPAMDMGSGSAISQSSRAVAEDRIDSMIACIEGAIQMYKNSPPGLQDGVLMTLRAALLSAVSTCNEIVAGSNAQNFPNYQTGTIDGTPAKERIHNMIGCIEGAVQMYKNSPPALQESVLITLQAALLSAVSTCNEIIADNDVQQHNMAGTTSQSTIPPTQFTDVTPETTTPEPAQATAPQQSQKPMIRSGNDENTRFLKEVYEKLQNAKGSGKMGLRDDLTAQEADELANDIIRMRSLLVEELDSGIPEADSGSASSSSSSTTSSYQEMLAKARAEKEGKQ